jgi:hypothetical protein
MYWEIDTSAVIDLAQWDSVAFTDSTMLLTGIFSIFRYHPGYLNLVAVYSEGKSDFLKGWSNYSPPLGLDKFSGHRIKSPNKMDIRKVIGGLYVDMKLSQGNVLPVSLAIYNITGQRIAQFSNIRNTPIFWNTSQQNLAEGLYLIRAELSDRNVINRMFMFTR